MEDVVTPQEGAEACRNPSHPSRPSRATPTHVRSESLGLSDGIQQPLTVGENCVVLKYPLAP